MVNGKMCIGISGDTLMCRFDPQEFEEIAELKGYEPMLMKGKVLHGYCYVTKEGFKTKKDFVFWLDLCLDFNKNVKSSKKISKAKKL